MKIYARDIEECCTSLSRTYLYADTVSNLKVYIYVCFECGKLCDDIVCISEAA